MQNRCMKKACNKYSSTLRGYRRPLLGSRAAFSQRNLLAAQFIRSAVVAIPCKPGRAPGTLGGDPRADARAARAAAGGARFARARADGRALRARTGGRALRARTAPSAPPGPRGQGAVGIIPRLFRMEVLSSGVNHEASALKS